MHQTKNRHFSLLLATALGSACVFGLSVPSAFADQEAPADETPAEETPEDEAPDDSAGPSAEDMAKAKEAFLKGKELFDAKDYENAVDQFKESYKLSKNPVLLYNIAFTHDEIGDQQMATFYYEKFLKDTDKGAANRDLARKRLRELKNESGGDTTDTGEVATVTAFKHAVVDEAPPGMPLDIVAVVPEGVPWRVVLHYRPSGEPKFTTVEMRYRFKELVARIPKTATTGKNVQYYIEVEDGSGKVLERSGEPTSPHIVYMEEGAKPRFYADTAGGQVNTQVTDSDTPLGGGNKSGGGGGSTVNTDGGWTDVQSTKFNKLKWGTTIGAASFVLLSGTFYLISASHNGTLEDEALKSQFGQCQAPPCNQFAQKQKDLQSLGQTYETLGTVGLALGATAAVAAGALWYMEMTDKGDKKDTTSLITVPAVGDNYIGAAASLRF